MMHGFLLLTLGGCLIASACFADPKTPEQAPASKDPTVVLSTNKGDITIRLYADKAPKTVANFLQYVNEGFYNGTIFHRVIDGFMVQGGGFTPDMAQKPTHATIKNEADNGLLNKRGTLGMARTSEVDSASSQFFINVVDNSFLDHRAKTRADYGYCVFAEVTKGMDVVDAIRKVPTSTQGMHQNVPVEPVIIKEARVVQGS